MEKEKPDIRELAKKIDELLGVLKVISGDLADVSRSLKNISEPAVTHEILLAPSEKRQNLNEIKRAFSSELVGMLLFEENADFIIIKPRRFLGSENFARIASVVRDLGGEYVSAGRNSHFKIAKE